MRTSKGFTLLEILIVIGLFVVMMIALYSFFVSSNSTYVYQSAYINTSGTASEIVTEVAEAALPARAVVISHVFSVGSLSSDTDTLVLELPSVDESGAIITGSYDYIAFYMDGEYVYRVTDGDPSSARNDGTKTLTAVAKSMSFSYDHETFADVASFIVDVETESSMKGTLISDRFQRTVYFRNKP